MNVVTFSDVSIMDRMSSARSSYLCWKYRCIETEYIVIILLPTSLLLYHSCYITSYQSLLVNVQQSVNIAEVTYSATRNKDKNYPSRGKIPLCVRHTG